MRARRGGRSGRRWHRGRRDPGRRTAGSGRAPVCRTAGSERTEACAGRRALACRRGRSGMRVAACGRGQHRRGGTRGSEAPCRRQRPSRCEVTRRRESQRRPLPRRSKERPARNRHRGYNEFNQNIKYLNNKSTRIKIKFSRGSSGDSRRMTRQYLVGLEGSDTFSTRLDKLQTNNNVHL